ncbi:MAG: protein HmcB [candidate division Zixibacteria bacterium RBG-1]|nr:MAG: protein HmcB [candidate division Zixibacteria bacterium RBG-1]OGC83598.1 MAG: hypothetical protein A2V73_06500 [candidate division Zixibacteria bacterium RBG_19FT_COMBO_42_43]
MGNINRRTFLKFSVIAATLGAAPSAKSQENFSGWPERYGMLTDTTLCIGLNCRKCEEACKKVNNLSRKNLNLSDNSVFEHKRRTDPENYTVVNRFPNPNKPETPYYVKKQCMHCDEPACASACLVKAFKKTPEGPVIYNKDVCIGCRYCMVACPFGIPSYDYFDAYTPQVRKCTMCYDRIQQGKIPACAEICPQEAITFGKRKDLIALARERIRSHPERYHPHIFGEEEAGGTSWLYLTGLDSVQLGFPNALAKTAYPELTRGFLSAVPLVLTIWPVLLVGLYKFSQSRQVKESPESTQNSVEESHAGSNGKPDN